MPDVEQPAVKTEPDQVLPPPPPPWPVPPVHPVRFSQLVSLGT